MRKLVFLLPLILALPAQAESLAPECAVPAVSAKPRQADIGADYVPGVDVRGKPVVPADGGLSGGPIIPEPLVVPVTIDLAERVGIPIDGAKMDATMGFLEIFADGRVLYNGQDLTRKIKDSCGRNQPIGVPSGDGQGQADVIEYAPIEEKTDPAPKPAHKPAPPKVEKPKGELIEGGDYAD